MQRILRQLGGLLIADIRRQRGDNTDGVFHLRTHMLAVGGDAAHAAVGQHQAAVAQVGDALEQAVGDDRFEGVVLQLAGLGGKAHRQVIANHFKSNLVDHFRDHRVDLAGDDAGAGLSGRQVDFAQAGARAG